MVGFYSVLPSAGFCEHLATGGPEWINAVTGLLMCAVALPWWHHSWRTSPFHMLVYSSIFANGLASAFYHVTLFYGAGLLDAFTMVLAVNAGVLLVYDEILYRYFASDLVALSYASRSGCLRRVARFIFFEPFRCLFNNALRLPERRVAGARRFYLRYSTTMTLIVVCWTALTLAISTVSEFLFDILFAVTTVALVPGLIDQYVFLGKPESRRLTTDELHELQRRRNEMGVHALVSETHANCYNAQERRRSIDDLREERIRAHSVLRRFFLVAMIAASAAAVVWIVPESICSIATERVRDGTWSPATGRTIGYIFIWTHAVWHLAAAWGLGTIAQCILFLTLRSHRPNIKIAPRLWMKAWLILVDHDE